MGNWFRTPQVIEFILVDTKILIFHQLIAILVNSYPLPHYYWIYLTLAYTRQLITIDAVL